MSDKGEDILKKLARANPVKENDLPDSALGARGDDLFARIQAGKEQPGRAVRSRQLRYRLVLAGVGLAIIAVAIILPLVLLDMDDDLRVTASHEPTTTSAIAETQAIRRDAALRGIIELGIELGLSPTSGESPDTRLVSLAQAMGVILPEEGPDYQLTGSVSRAQYAVWLWRAFGSHLPAKTSVGLEDLSSLTAEEQQAALGLAAAGVLESGDVRFRGSDGLTPQAEEMLIDQVRRAVQTGR